MKNRYYIPGDEEQVKKLCEAEDIDVPKDAMVMVAEDNEGKIVGLCGIKLEPYFDPFISHNSIAAIKLFLNMMNAYKKIVNKKYIRCVCNPEYEKLYNKVGFMRIDENKITMEKRIK